VFIKFDDIHDYSLGRIEAVTTATASTTKGLEAILAEALDYSKKSFERHQGFVDKLLRVRSPYELIDLQPSYAKAAYDDFSATAAKISELYSELSKQAFGTLINGASKSDRGGAPAKTAATIPARETSVAAAAE
jgi:hypothetical protein